MIALDETSGMCYGVLEHDDLAAMARLLAEAFSLYEPPAVAVGLPFPDVEAIVKTFGPKATTEGLSIVARDVSNREMLGALLVEDFATPPPDGIEQLPATFKPIAAALEELDAPYRASRNIVPGTHLHLFMIGVSQRAWGRRIAQALVAQCLANGRRRGYTVALTEATGRVSQHVFRKLGFQEIALLSYQDFLFDGRRVFSSLIDEVGCILMEREVGDKRRATPKRGVETMTPNQAMQRTAGRAAF